MKWNEIRIGTLGGTLCSLWISFSINELLQTVLMAAIGTAVSFVTSSILGKMNKRK